MGTIQNDFQRMGARVKVHASPHVQDVEVNVRRDGGGEYFVVRHREDVDLAVLECAPWNRHLVLTAHDPRVGDEAEADSTFLCGHDERSWFVAAVPESARARTVQEARDALKPPEVWQSIEAHNVPASQRDGRRNAAFVRQGEWFFLPRPELKVDARDVLEREPIRRGAGKPHVCQHLHRFDGVPVWVSADAPNGIPDAEFRKLPKAERRSSKWRHMWRDARVYVKGAIEHPDHATIWLPCWHRVVMNTETQARSMRNVAFLD
jgi:hypothetical protein